MTDRITKLAYSAALAIRGRSSNMAIGIVLLLLVAPMMFLVFLLIKLDNGFKHPALARVSIASAAGDGDFLVFCSVGGRAAAILSRFHLHLLPLLFNVALGRTPLWAVASQQLFVTFIQRPPGHKLWVLIDCLFSAKTRKLVFEPIIRDMRDEYNEALALKQYWRARCGLGRSYWSFWSAFLAHIPLSIGRTILALWNITT